MLTHYKMLRGIKVEVLKYAFISRIEIILCNVMTSLFLLRDIHIQFRIHIKYILYSFEINKITFIRNKFHFAFLVMILSEMFQSPYSVALKFKCCDSLSSINLSIRIRQNIIIKVYFHFKDILVIFLAKSESKSHLMSLLELIYTKMGEWLF